MSKFNLEKRFFLHFKKNRYKNVNEGLSLREALKLPQFYMLISMMYLQQTGVNLCLFYYKVNLNIMPEKGRIVNYFSRLRC